MVMNKNRKSLILFVSILVLCIFYNGTGEKNMKNYITDGFSWVIDKKLSGLPFPGVFDPEEDDIAFLKEKGLTLLVSLTLNMPNTELLKRSGIRSAHYPVKDFHAPKTSQLEEFCIAADREIEKGGRVAVHCYAGKGRTGTFLAAYFVFKGAQADGAIELIRSLRPGSIETDEQEEAVRVFQRSLKKESGYAISE